MAYSVIGPERIRVIATYGTPQGDDFPYKKYPMEFKRQPIELGEMPTTIRKLYQKWKGFHGENITQRNKQTLSRWLGHRVRVSLDLWRHQFGGIPWLIQGPEKIQCPNQKCPNHRHKKYMKVLAAIHNDPESGLPMVERARDIKNHEANFWVQVVYHICPECLTLHVGNRCD